MLSLRFCAIAGAGLLLLTGLLYVVSPSPTAAAPTHLRGVSVVDGNTLQIGGRIFRLYGIDAPELGQLCHHDKKWDQCGVTAAFELRKLLKLDAPLTCTRAAADRKRYICHAGRTNLAKVLLGAGYAVAAPGSGAAYHHAEQEARDGKLGLWHMTFLPPSAWRAGKRLPGAPDAQQAKCPIKGVIDPAGRKLFYVPTDRGYKKIKVDPLKDEKSFCSVRSARAAGWRRPGEAPRRQRG
jgi:endonuclease YncB( thermonuclease family)